MGLDKYYTDPTIASKCTLLFAEYIKVKQNDIIIEPSAGNGAFIPSIQKICKHPIFIDIAPEHPLVKKADYLDLQLQHMQPKTDIYVIGNPPFGVKSSLAIKFIRKSCQFCKAFGFILPRSFANKYMQKSVPLNFHLMKSIHLPDNSFIFEGRPYTVPSVFQIWKKYDYLRNKEKKMTPSGYKFVRKTQRPDFAIRRVGNKSGHITIKPLSLLSSNSHYFVKLNEPKNMQKIHDINPPNKYNVTGQICISKRTIIKYINKMLK